MKLTTVSVAVAAACGMLSVPAFAIPASSYGTGTTTFDVRISGATAQDPGLLASTVRNCVAGSLTRYQITNNFVYFCTLDLTKITPPPGKTQLAVYKNSVGGSAQGVAPVNGATQLPFLSLPLLTAACTGASSTADPDGTGPLGTYQDIAACAGNPTALATPFIGISDVEPSFFGPATTYNKLKAEPFTTVIFGVPVTKVAYEYLQGQQAKTVGALDAANLPSLSQAQVTSLYTQEGQTWSGITGGAALAPDDQVYVARRVDTSGSQKTFEAVIARTTNGTGTGKSCTGNIDPFVNNPAAIALDNTAANLLCDGTNNVVLGSGGGQVVACLNKHQAGTGTLAVPVASRGAIGVLSTETIVSAASGFRFVKINGIAPNYAGVASGQYTQYSDASLNTRIGTTLPTAAEPGYSSYISRLKSDFASPGTNPDFVQPFGPSGLMSLDVLQAVVPTADYTGAAGRNPWSRLSSGALENCQPGKAAAF
jgi:hypothetical protein